MIIKEARNYELLHEDYIVVDHYVGFPIVISRSKPPVVAYIDAPATAYPIGSLVALEDATALEQLSDVMAETILRIYGGVEDANRSY